MIIQRSRFIGHEGVAFERVGLAFLAYGYEAPQSDSPGGYGAFVDNIASQYYGALTEPEVLALIEYGLTHSREDLQEERNDPSLLMYTLDQLTDRYLDQN